MIWNIGIAAHSLLHVIPFCLSTAKRGTWEEKPHFLSLFSVFSEIFSGLKLLRSVFRSLISVIFSYFQLFLVKKYLVSPKLLIIKSFPVFSGFVMTPIPRPSDSEPPIE